ncbi:MAG: hypothetical protein Q7R96_01630 [Nanoarchaeota archaeon]|nr:hypothetical protein [Nanoarchaeota archaeon]
MYHTQSKPANGELTESQKRALLGKALGDWVIAKNHQEQPIACGRILGADTESGAVHMEGFSRYTMTADGYVKRPESFEQVIGTADVASFTASSEEEVMGSRAVSPFVENLEREVQLTVEGKEYFGKLARVLANVVVLSPYMDQGLFPEDEIVLNQGELLLPIQPSAFPRPLRHPLEKIVARYNELKKEHEDKEKEKK